MRDQVNREVPASMNRPVVISIAIENNVTTAAHASWFRTPIIHCPSVWSKRQHPSTRLVPRGKGKTGNRSTQLSRAAGMQSQRSEPMVLTVCRGDAVGAHDRILRRINALQQRCRRERTSFAGENIC